MFKYICNIKDQFHMDRLWSQAQERRARKSITLFLVAAVWRQDELARIDSMFTGAERKAALCALLEKEAQLIASIGRHKLNADEENEQKAILFFLEKVSEIILRWSLTGARINTDKIADKTDKRKAQQLPWLIEHRNWRLCLDWVLVATLLLKLGNQLVFLVPCGGLRQRGAHNAQPLHVFTLGVADPYWWQEQAREGICPLQVMGTYS